MKSHLIDIVRQEDKCAELPDLKHTPIVTIEQPYASLLVCGVMQSYKAKLLLPSRRQNQKVYVRAAERINEATLELMQQDTELRTYLRNAYPELKKFHKNNPSVSYIPFTVRTGQEEVKIHLPLNGIIGHIVAESVTPKLWEVWRATMLAKHYKVAGRGGFYYLRELRAN